MESKSQIFSHPKFGEFYTLTRNDEIWFKAADVCRTLEIGDIIKALSRLDDDEKCFLESTSPVKNYKVNQGDTKKIWLVNEFGLYRLIMSSRMPKAKEFQRWIYHEVLPAIRKYGCYSLVTENKPVVRKPNPKRRAAQLADACVYIAKMSNETVKIGNCHDTEDRKSRLQSEYKLTVEEIHKTFLMPRKLARAVEKACHKIFSPFKTNGEFFNVDYKTACRILDALEALIIAGAANKQGVPVKADKLLVDTTND